MLSSYKIFAITWCILFSSQGLAMSLFLKKNEVEAVLFSPMDGRLTFNGKPAGGAKIKLWTSWKDKKGEVDTYESDENGFFAIPVKKVLYKENPLVQISIGQTVTVEYDGKSFLIWEGGKTRIKLYGELGGRPIDLECEITEEEMDHHVEYSLIGTTCKWRNLDKKEFEDERVSP